MNVSAGISRIPGEQYNVSIAFGSAPERADSLVAAVWTEIDSLARLGPRPEELTKVVLESGLLQEWDDRYALTAPLPPLAIPTTLHDSLMARLDRLAAVKGLAQLGATLGREFAYALLQAVSPWDEGTLRHGLQQLVEAWLLPWDAIYSQRPMPA